MKKASTLTRLQRLELLEARLKSDELLIVRNLASELGVSERTLGRDIELLRERGLPIEADRGRGGGVRLHWSWGIGRINLSYREAVDLLVSLAVVEQLNSPILMANLGPIRRKLDTRKNPSSLMVLCGEGFCRTGLRILGDCGCGLGPFPRYSADFGRIYPVAR